MILQRYLKLANLSRFCFATTKIPKKISLRKPDQGSKQLKKPNEQPELRSKFGRAPQPVQQGLKFDEFTSKIVDGELDPAQIIEKPKATEEAGLEFPWDFNRELKLSDFSEGNLKCIVDYSRILDYDAITKLLETYTQSLVTHNMEEMQPLLERDLYKKLKKILANFKAESKKIQLERGPLTFDLLNITNFFTVGACLVRSRNYAPRHYHIYDSMIKNDIPARFYVMKKPREDTKMRLIAQFDVAVHGIRLGITSKDGEVSQDKDSYHLFRLECEVAQSDHKDFKRYTNDRYETSEAAFHKFSNNLNDITLSICDIDHFMKGNPLIGEPLASEEDKNI